MDEKQSQQLTNQLSRVADELHQVANQLQQQKSSPNLPQLPEDQSSEPILDPWQMLSGEAQNIITTALDQLTGNKPPDLPADQLYGWVDSISMQLGNKPTAQTDEIRQLQKLVDDLKHSLKQ